jgi:two-component system nitrogen regulation response regulator GlnG
VQFDFPGNVRQLENICHWLTVMAPAQAIEAKDLPPELGEGAALRGSAAPVSAAAAGPQAVPVTGPVSSVAAPAPVTTAPAGTWLHGLEQDARGLLQSGAADVWDTLTKRFEAQLIHTALEITRGRRIEAAQKLGIGRNTITRKIQELGLDE